jgi:hypothetical protein
MPDHLLQPLYLITQWRLSNAQPFRRLTEMKGFGDSKKVAQVSKLDLSIHIHSI